MSFQPNAMDASSDTGRLSKLFRLTVGAYFDWEVVQSLGSFSSTGLIRHLRYVLFR